MFCILKEGIRIGKSKRYKQWYVFCNIYNRFGWVDASKVKAERTTTGRRFPIVDFDGDINKYLQQFNFYKTAGYPYSGAHKEYVHRIVWKLLRGEIPEGYEIDHINRNKNDYDISNLRLVSHRENCFNVDKRNSNTGHKGVHRNKSNNRYYVQYGRKKLGSFLTLEEALKVRKEAERASNFEIH